jgi:hypothetical protein
VCFSFFKKERNFPRKSSDVPPKEYISGLSLLLLIMIILPIVDPPGRKRSTNHSMKLQGKVSDVFLSHHFQILLLQYVLATIIIVEPG